MLRRVRLADFATRRRQIAAKHQRAAAAADEARLPHARMQAHIHQSGATVAPQIEPDAYVSWQDPATETQYAMIARYIPNLRDIHLPDHARKS
eukprot:COSAG01_NODE_19544_length_1004_cov_1.140331_2_plen_92_part_01